jgi:hypothetical protein
MRRTSDKPPQKQPVRLPRLIETIDLTPDEVRELKKQHAGDKRLKFVLANDPDEFPSAF